MRIALFCLTFVFFLAVGVNGQTDDDYVGDDTYGKKKVVWCFSGAATVEVLNKGTVSMEHLEVGDYVLTAANRKNAYQPVYAFGHVDAEKSVEYYSIATTTSTFNSSDAHKPLEISGNHLLYVQNKAGPVRADSIRVGDVLRGNAVVTDIENVIGKGLYAPYTTDGTIIVDGIVASSYVDLISAKKKTNEEHDGELAVVGGVVLPFLTQAAGIHLGLSPLRLVCRMVDGGGCQSYNENGFNHYVHYGIEFAFWTQDQSPVFQFAALIMFMLITGVSYAMESMLLLEASMMMTIMGLMVISLTFYSLFPRKNSFTKNIHLRDFVKQQRQKQKKLE